MANVEKVKQGLRCCKNSYPKDCKHCPYEMDCTHHETCDILVRNALSMIESLQSEIKILSENCDGLEKQRDDFAQTIHEQKMEIERLKENIDTLLPVLHGEWEEKEYSIGKCYAICSLCKESSIGYAKDTGFGFEYSFPNYCPHCGAKMDNPQPPKEGEQG